MVRRMALVVVVLASACSGGGVGSTTTIAESPIIVAAADGSLTVMGRDGDVERTIVEGGAVRATQPALTSDGTRLVWSEAGSEGSTVRIAELDGDTVNEVRLPIVPFYYLWNPSGSRLAALGAGAQEIDLWIVDGVEPQADPLATGEPLYLTWLDDDRLVAHVGLDRLAVFDLAGGEVIELSGGGAFQAPAASDGAVYHAVDGTLVEQRGDTVVEVVDFDGFAQFVVSPDGTRLALRVVGDQPEAVTASVGAQAAVPNQLVVLDLETMDSTPVLNRDVGTFFWSPDSQKLLVYTVPGDGLLHPSVWQDGDLIEYEPFDPSLTMVRDYLAFFDQYAQTLTYWSPGSDAFLFAGSIDNEAGIWVQPLDGEPERIARGVFAMWGPGS